MSKRTESRLAEEKKKWAVGLWTNEPDYREWEYNGMFCLIRRNLFGALCGYVGVPPDSPLFGKAYNDEIFYDLRPHGDLTFGGVLFPERHPGIWLLGFDCARADDYVPGRAVLIPILDTPPAAYRDFTYVVEAVERLADQLAPLNEGVTSHE